MAGCCPPKGCAEVFDTRLARSYADRYRRNGLDSTARRMVSFLSNAGIEGRTVLEVGGGVGGVQLELLRAGAARAINVEISPSYEDEARRLLEEAGVQSRVERHVLDFARQAETVEAADVVVMHKVICCYPDMEALMAAAAAHARRFLAVSFPRDSWWTRLPIWLGNLWWRFRRSDFRAYVHPPRAILAAAQADGGLRPVLEHRGWIWQTAVLERSTWRS